MLYPADGVAVTPSPPPPGVLFTPLDPVRILDSRASSQEGPYSTPWQTQTVREVVVAGDHGVPADAEAVVLNVTATGTTASSHLRIYPAGGDLPTVSNLNWQAGWTVPNAVTVKVGDGGSAEGKINVYNNNGSANVIIDVVGYYKTDTGAGLTSLDPVRIIDSRPSSQVGPYNSPWLTQTTRDVTVTDAPGVPAEGGRRGAQRHRHRHDGVVEPANLACRITDTARLQPQLATGLDDPERGHRQGRGERSDQRLQQQRQRQRDHRRGRLLRRGHR